MHSFQHETIEVDGDSEVAPARVHPGDADYVIVPVRWLRERRYWMESPGHVIRLQEDVWLVGYSLGHLFGDMMDMCPAEIANEVGSLWPTFVELVANSAREDFTSPSLHRVPDPDTFCTPPSEMTFVGVVVHRLSGVRADEFGVVVMNRLYGLVDVCLGLQAELAACPPPAPVRRSRRLVPLPRWRSSEPDLTPTGVGRLGDIARRLRMNPGTCNSDGNRPNPAGDTGLALRG